MLNHNLVAFKHGQTMKYLKFSPPSTSNKQFSYSVKEGRPASSEVP